MMLKKSVPSRRCLGGNSLLIWKLYINSIIFSDLLMSLVSLGNWIMHEVKLVSIEGVPAANWRRNDEIRVTPFCNSLRTNVSRPWTSLIVYNKTKEETTKQYVPLHGERKNIPTPMKKSCQKIQISSNCSFQLPISESTEDRRTCYTLLWEYKQQITRLWETLQDKGPHFFSK